MLDLLDLLLLELKALSGDFGGVSRPGGVFCGSFPLFDLLLGLGFCSGFFSRFFGLSKEPLLLGPGLELVDASLLDDLLFFGSVLVDGALGLDISISVASREVVLIGIFDLLSVEGDRGT